MTAESSSVVKTLSALEGPRSCSPAADRFSGRSYNREGPERSWLTRVSCRTEDYPKRNFRSQPEQSELIRKHILVETSAEPLLQAKQLQLKRSRLALNLNETISHRPGLMELILKNIPPIHSSANQAFIDTEFTKASGDNPSCDEDSNDSVPPEKSGSRSPLSLGPVPYPSEKLAGSNIPSLTQPKSNPDRSAQRYKKHMDNGPKIKKLKYHQYIPPEQKGDKEPPPDLDSSYTKILQQQQLFLQLQILSQQQQHNIHQPILPAASKPMKDQLDEMKVAELKSELRLRSLPVYGTKNDLIKRLRAYKGLNGGCDITSSPTAGGTTGPGARGAVTSSKTASANTTSQQPFQRSSLTTGVSSSATTPRTTRQLMTCSDAVTFPPISLIPFDQQPAAKSPADSSFNSDPLGEMISSPLTQLSLQACSGLLRDIKEEPPCSTPTPCLFSLKPGSLQKHCPVSSTDHSARSIAPVLTVDKDKMLQEKDKQIEELTRMLRQKQKLVEALKMQLENGKRGARVPDPVVLVRVKQEPPDVPLSYGHSPLSCPPSSISCEMDATKLTVKQEAVEAEEVVSEATVRPPHAHGFPPFLMQEAQKQVRLQTQIEPEPTSALKKEPHICLQQTTLQLTQQQVIEKHLLQQQHSIQDYNGMLEIRQHLQKLSRQRKKKSHKQQQKQENSQQQHEQLKQHLQPMQLKQQILLKQQTSSLKQQIKPQQLTNQPQQIQIQINLKQQQVLIQKNPQLQQQSPLVSEASLDNQPGSALSFPLDVLKSDSYPTLVTDGNGNHFLIALSSHVTEKQRTNALKATNHVTLQAQTGGVQVSVDQQQGAAQCLSAPPGLKPFFKAPSGKNTLSPSSQTEDRSSLEVLDSPLSSGSKMAASSPGNKDTEPKHEDFTDMILQAEEMPTVFKPEPDMSLHCLYPNSSTSSTCTSPLQLLHSPPVSLSCDTAQPVLMVQCEPESQVDPTEKKQHLSNAEGGRLEDFLESTMEKPLLGEEPGGLLVLIDDLQSQTLCTPSILDHLPSPMDTFNMLAEAEQRLNFNDWLDLNMGGDTHEQTPTLSPPGPQTPFGIFSADFLDSNVIE